MKKPIFNFGSIVIVEGNLVGVVVKSWDSTKEGYNHDVYVRSYNSIKNYKESELTAIIYDKELSEEQLEYY